MLDSHEEGKRCIRTSIATSKQITKLIQPLSSKQPEYGPTSGRSFSVAAPTLGNSLPDNVKSPFVDLDLILSNVFCFDAGSGFRFPRYFGAIEVFYFLLYGTRIASHLARSDTPSITCIVARISCSDTPT